jgi:hypothetical protein
MTGIAVLDLALVGNRYLAEHRVLVLLIAVSAAGAAVAASSVRRWFGSSRADVPRRLRSLRYLPVAVGSVVIVGMLAIRPDCCPVVSEVSNSFEAVALRNEGLPLDGRTYTELSPWWVVWYLGPLGLVAYAAVLWSLWPRSTFWRNPTRTLLAVAASPFAVYLLHPSITGDHVWASRRHLTVLIPAAILFGLAVTRDLVMKRPSFAPIVNLVTIGLVVITTALGAGTLGLVEWRGATAEVRSLCAAFDGDPVLFVDGPGVGASSLLAQPLRNFCRVPVARVDALPPDYRPAGVVLLSANPALLGNPTQVREVFRLETEELERTITRRPTATSAVNIAVWGLRVDSEGRMLELTEILEDGDG